MYSVMLAVHSWMRWGVLITALAATFNAWRSYSADGQAPGKWWDTLFMLAVDLQLLVGLLLYFGLSPFTKLAMSNLGQAMANPQLRFWAVEHAVAMLLAIVLVRMGRILGVNAAAPASARRRRIVCFTLATVIMLASVPWPGLSNGRPLFRL